MFETWESVACPECGGPARLRPADSYAPGTVYCEACVDCRECERAEREPRWRAAYPQFSSRVRNALNRAGLEPSDLPHQPDSRLLAIWTFGQGMLAEVRAICPAPPEPPAPVYAPCAHCGGTGRIVVEG